MKQMSATSVVPALAGSWNVTTRQNSCAPTAAEPIAKHSPAITSVTTGPATAILKSTPGESASFRIFATPPNIHRSMPAIPMPLRIATAA